jgi:hypothetical protein
MKSRPFPDRWSGRENVMRPGHRNWVGVHPTLRARAGAHDGFRAARWIVATCERCEPARAALNRVAQAPVTKHGTCGS